MKERRTVAIRSTGAMLCMLLAICVGVMGQGCPFAPPPPAPGDNNGDGDGGGGGDQTPTTGNSGVTGQFISAEARVVVDPATNDVRVGCAFCHPAAHADWAATKHSTALETLEAIGQGSNATCLPCHTVGFGEAGGFVNRQTTNALAGVQCESCHGAGGPHVSNIMDPGLYPPASVAMLDANICGKCHQDVHHPIFEEWSESAHAGGHFWEADAPDFVADTPNRVAACGECHSGDARHLKVFEGVTLTNSTLKDLGLTLDDINPITCVTCHDPHRATGLGAALTGHQDTQLRHALVVNSAPSDLEADTINPERFGLCGQCHHTRAGDHWKKTARPPHYSHQANMLNGEMMVPPGTPSLVSNRQHAHTFTARSCATCHMYREQSDNPNDVTPTISGHTFEVNLAGCIASGCHPGGQNIAGRTEALQTDTKNRLEALRLRLEQVHPNKGWEFTSNGGPNAGGQAALSDNVKQVRFIYHYVYADGSFGLHNPSYTDRLLTYAQFLPLP